MSTPTSLVTATIIASLVAIGALSTDMYLPAFPTLAEAFSADVGEVQGTLSIYLIGFALSQLVLGPLSDHFGRKPVLLAGLGLFALSSIAITFSSSIEMLTMLRFLQALGGSAGSVLGRAMVRDIYGPLESARVLSYISTAMALAPAVAPILGGYLLLWFGWQASFLFLAVYALLGAGLLHYRIPETAPASNTSHLSLAKLNGDFWLLLKHPTWRWYTLICSFIFAGLFAFLSGSPFVVIDYLGYSEQEYGFLFTFVVAGFMTGTLIGGRTVRSVGVERLIGVGIILAVVGGVVMAALGIGRVDHIVAIILPHMCYMVGVGIVMPQTMAAALAPFPEIAGTSSALLGFFQMAFAALVGVGVGHFHDGTPVVMTVTIGLMALLGLFSYLMLQRQGGRDTHGDAVASP
ncbi:MAG: multidrug effflux MFS transporter [Chromatiales bacterium]|nr:multidrug effflux MFS transporter [Chromatiales bacterium]